MSDDELRVLESSVAESLKRHSAALLKGLREEGFWASDGPVLPPTLRGAMRSEVEALWAGGAFAKSQSVLGKDLYYDKHNVYATEIDGSKYEVAPRMVHYTVSTTKAFAELVSGAFPEANLSGSFIGNKLNLCVGHGAYFDPHLDVGVQEKPFNRKLTVLIYLNSAWRPDLGGEITILGEGATEAEATASNHRSKTAAFPAKLAPTSGRWVVFWSDRMLHRVEASQAPHGIDDYRISYTIWLCTQEEQTAAASMPYEKAPEFARL